MKTSSRYWSPLLIVAFVLAFLFHPVGLQLAAAESAQSSYPGEDASTGAIVGVRPRLQSVRQGGPFTATLDDEITVDFRAPERFYQNLIDREILPDPRIAKDAAQRDAEKQEEEEVKKLSEPDRTTALQKIAERREQRFQNTMDGWLQQMSLFFDGRPIPALAPQFTYHWLEYTADPKLPPVGNYALEYHLRKTDENRDAWFDLLRGQGVFDRPTVVSVGFNKVVGDRTDIVPSYVNTKGAKDWQRFSLRTAPFWSLAVSCILIALLVVLGLILARDSDLLRDVSAPLNPNERHPFSLALCQMAFWLFILTASFLFLWVVTREYNTLTASELTLLGISSLTGLSAVLINQVSPPAAPSTLTAQERQERKVEEISKMRVAAEAALTAAAQELEVKRNSLLQATAVTKLAIQQEVDTAAAEADQLKKRVFELTDRERYFKPWGALRQFFLDLLRERCNVDFHRFQMMAWTLILGIVFVFGVFQQLAMPKFDATLLILMGISNGTYLGFKLPTAQKES